MNPIGMVLVPMALFFTSFLFFWLVLPRLPGIERKTRSVLPALLLSVIHVVTACMAVFIFFICLYMLFWMALGGAAKAAGTAFAVIIGIETLTLLGITAGLIYAFKSERTYLVRRKLAPFAAAFLLLALEGGIGLGLAQVLSDNSRAGYINTAGKFVIEPRFATGGQFDHGIAEVKDDFSTSSAPYFIDAQGKKVEPSEDLRQKYSRGDRDEMDYRELTINTKTGDLKRDEYSEGLAIARGANSRYFGYVDESEKLVIPEKFEDVRPFHDGLAAACIDLDENLQDPEVSLRQGRRTWGYIDKKGNWAIKPQFSSAQSFSDGLGCVSMFFKKNPDSKDPDPEMVERYGYIDKTGKFVLPAVFKFADPFSEGLACVTVDSSSPQKDWQQFQQLQQSPATTPKN